MKKSIVTAVLAAGSAVVLGAAPAMATSSMSYGSSSATFYTDTDTFRVCDTDIAAGNYAEVQWHTASLSGVHSYNKYLSTQNNCTSFDHAFVRGAAVTWRLCDHSRPGNEPETVCLAWRTSWSES